MKTSCLSAVLLTLAAIGCGQSSSPSAPPTPPSTVTATPAPDENAEAPASHEETLEAGDVQLVTLHLPGMT